jgi:hypothetical protein
LSHLQRRLRTRDHLFHSGGTGGVGELPSTKGAGDPLDDPVEGTASCAKNHCSIAWQVETERCEPTARIVLASSRTRVRMASRSALAPTTRARRLSALNSFPRRTLSAIAAALGRGTQQGRQLSSAQPARRVASTPEVTPAGRPSQGGKDVSANPGEV